MKTDILSTASLALVLFASCASQDGFIAQDTKRCGPGVDVEINAGFDPSNAPQADRIDSRVTFMVEVANNSDHEITVKTVRVEPMAGNREEAYQLQGNAVTFDKVVPEGDSSMFEIPLSSSYAGSQFGNPNMRNRGTTGRDVDVMVSLTSGETVRCRFRVPVPA
jgi:hypothetical protein